MAPMQPMQPQMQQQQQQQPMGGAMPDPTQYFQGAAGQQMASMGLQYGQAMFNQNAGAAVETLQRYGVGSDSLRNYFNVDNSYVFSRLKLLAFPFRRSKNWQ